MAAGMKFDDRAWETCTAPGTGNFTMNGAVQGAITFATFMTTTGDYTTYKADNGTAWETGYITRQANGTYARTVKRSTNGNAAVNFATGTISVICDLPAWLVDHLNLIEETVASAATADLGLIQSKCIQLTGTTPPTSFGTGKNKERIVRYTGAGLTITNSATIVCPGAVDLTLATNDIFCVVSDNSSNPIWRIMWVAPISKRIAAGTFTRVMSTASGNQSITGVGFKPKFIQFQTGIGGGQTWASIGQSDGSANNCMEFNTGNFFPQSSLAGIQRDGAAGSNYNSFTVASLDSDGFTVTWTKVGTPTATATINYTAYRG
jgi:hypothetical protein